MIETVRLVKTHPFYFASSFLLLCICVIQRWVFEWTFNTKFIFNCNRNYSYLIWALSNSAPTLTHLHSLPSTTTHPKWCSTHTYLLQPSKRLPNTPPTTLTHPKYPLLTQDNTSLIATHTKYGPITLIYSNFSLITM